MKTRHIALAALALCTIGASHARVTRIVIDERLPLAASDSGGKAYEQLAGRAFGELDPGAPGRPAWSGRKSRRSAPCRRCPWQGRCR